MWEYDWDKIWKQLKNTTIDSKSKKQYEALIKGFNGNKINLVILSSYNLILFNNYNIQHNAQ